jgi:hypothetical protein
MRRWMLIVLSGCGVATSACATSVQPLRVAPRVETPAEAKRPCEIYRLPPAPNQSDLELGYAERGAQIVACDAARRLAVESHEAEHALEDEALKAGKHH